MILSFKMHVHLRLHTDKIKPTGTHYNESQFLKDIQVLHSISYIVANLQMKTL